MISDAELDRLKADLDGTCQALDPVLERLGIDASVEEAEDRLLDGNGALERCMVCDWWHEVCMLEFSEAHHGGVCQQCVPELFE